MSARKIKEGAKELASYQDNFFMDNGYLSKEFITFTFDGLTIFNPWYNLAGSAKVDPIEYYGDAFLDSGFCEDA